MKNANTIQSLVGPLLRNFLTGQLIALGSLFNRFTELGRLCHKLAKALLAWN